MCTPGATLFSTSQQIYLNFFWGVEVLGFAVSFSAAGELSPPLTLDGKTVAILAGNFSMGR